MGENGEVVKKWYKSEPEAQVQQQKQNKAPKTAPPPTKAKTEEKGGQEHE